MSYGDWVISSPKTELSPIDYMIKRLKNPLELGNYKYVVIDNNVYNKMQNSTIFTNENNVWTRQSMTLNGFFVPRLVITLIPTSSFACKEYIVISLSYGSLDFTFSSVTYGKGISLSSR